ncbi:MAG TPA: hypothetical protein VGO59_21135 [Verrucomicrobiae bacterium]|jgi:hypothetical protein
MKTTILKNHSRQGGWALLVVMALAAAGLLLMASIMTWSNENSAVTARNSELFTTTYAAESATEKALSAIVQDDQNYGEGLVFTKYTAASYNGLIPNTTDSPYWANYQFSGGTTNNKVIVKCLSTTTTNVLGPPYSGLQSVGSTYQIIANAQNRNSQYGIQATVGQQIVLGQIPIFQFAIFYNDTMEIGPGAVMNIVGMVHGNTNIYIDPGSTLTFSNDISATGTLNLTWNPLNPVPNNPMAAVNFDGSHLADVNPLNLPVGTNTSGSTTNVAASVDAILQVPPAGESPNSTTGTNRLYNQVDLIVSISNGNVITVTSGVAVNNAATVISNSQWASWINTNGSFYNMRDGTQVDPVNINVGALRQWSATNTVLRPLLSSLRGSTVADVQSIFVADNRFMSNTVITTNYTYTTNTATTTTSNYPSANTYVPPVATNTSVTTTSSNPSAGTYVPPILATNVTSVTTANRPTSNYVNSITTNTTLTTTASYPSGGTYLGGVTTNTTPTTSSTRPSSGTYVGTIVTNGGFPRTYTYQAITSYTCNLIISYSYFAISGYIINGITGFTYAGITSITTNVFYITNYIEYAEPGIVMTNGATLPSNGLSIVTPDPAYVAGNWNCSTNGSTFLYQTYNVANTLPSAFYADSFTVLSPSWNPNSSTNSISSRIATSDTVNAAILTGIVPSNGINYSGGVENFPRFLENWAGVSLYYNGSMVEMFTSQISNTPWPGTGTVYNPPTRNWAFDTNFNDPAKLPPLTPRVIYLNRARWSSLTPGATVF